VHRFASVDPTEYTRSKREAEMLVANSGLSFLIVRPSVVIGDSRDGHYSGKAYGLYQYWTAYEKFLSDRYRDEIHLIAPDVKLQVIHQDAFQASFLAAYRNLPRNLIVHLVSRQDTLPTIREVCQIWNAVCGRAHVVHYYNNLSEVPADGLDRRMRMWLEFTSVNGEIAAHSWHFQTTALEHLRAGGLKIRDATIGSINICQERFIAKSSRLQAFSTKVEQGLREVGSPQLGLTLSSIS
jgi:nucleoside-diphosphate-sugar epimerase